MGIKDYFKIEELVCPHVYKQFGHGAWIFLDKHLLEVLLVIREKLGKPIIVNNWADGGSYSQRGLRCNVCALVREKSNLEKVYLSMHVFGKAVDFHVPGMTAEEVRQWIARNQILLPHNIRIEKDIDWVHIDVRDDGKQRITYFKA